MLKLFWKVFKETSKESTGKFLKGVTTVINIFTILILTSFVISMCLMSFIILSIGGLKGVIIGLVVAIAVFVYLATFIELFEKKWKELKEKEEYR